VYHDPDERLVRFDFATGKRHPKFDLRLAGVGALSSNSAPTESGCSPTTGDM
jgi:hypothetical protein